MNHTRKDEERAAELLRIAQGVGISSIESEAMMAEKLAKYREEDTPKIEEGAFTNNPRAIG